MKGTSKHKAGQHNEILISSPFFFYWWGGWNWIMADLFVGDIERRKINSHLFKLKSERGASDNPLLRIVQSDSPSPHTGEK